MDYDNYSNQALIDKIRELEKDKNQQEKKREELVRSHYFMTGYLGPWHWYVTQDKVAWHPVQREMLFASDQEYSETFSAFLKLIHKDDQEKVKKEFNQHLKGQTAAVEVEYRIRFNDGNYHWLYHRAEIDDVDAPSAKISMTGALLDITEKRETEEKLSNEKTIHEKEATMDFLTNLLNRRGFHRHLRRYYNSSNFDGNVVIAMFDIDNFKQANDTFGHEYGDQVLLDISKLFRDNTRNADIVSRFGGDEFLIIFTDTTLENGYEVCERIRKHTQKKYQDKDVEITISGGVGQYENEDREELIAKVDNLLYHAKNHGKNRIVKQ